MAINYGSLKQSEDNLIKKFYEYLSHTYKMHLVVVKAFELYSNKDEFHKKTAQVFELEKISNITQADLLDECTWIISKEQPQASHLRFVIAIINSINDLERICDYANNLAKFLENNINIRPEDIYPLKSMEELAVNNYLKIFEYFKTHDATSCYKYAEQLLNEFTQEFRCHLKTFKGTYFGENGTNNDAEIAVAIILAFKNVERIMDHVMNIIEYFIYIKECNFFFDKRVI
ncbi:phosphate signaling complex protein PhoU [[Mycoplasma] testudinis]|uniref:phosphate signaling complex protein PhoU n=1 Tax=[Mycoplasma] testudinis TaxID=33924 RepID=UPI000483D3DA|nr:phosphate signaling complex protein PhoU [[Mycoplasma] testudinis]